MRIYSASSAVELNDVLANAQFLSSTMRDAFGRPIVVPRAIAVYERDGGTARCSENTTSAGANMASPTGSRSR
jgi:Cu2+-containing amine oxidase